MKSETIEILKNSGVGVIPTDTLYGLVASAFLPDAVQKVVDTKKRTEGKGFIVLIASIQDLESFGIEISEPAKIFMTKYWPGKISIEFTCEPEKFHYLKKDDHTVAFRMPNKKELLDFLKQTGPLIAPTANPEGLPPAKNIEEAQKYFGDQVDFYEDGGDLDSLPSTLVRIKGDKIEVLRDGAVKISQ